MILRNSIYVLVLVDWCKVGIGICYDVRFPELAQLYAKKGSLQCLHTKAFSDCVILGCKLLCYPGAFNMTTGPAHWESLHTGR